MRAFAGGETSKTSTSGTAVRPGPAAERVANEQEPPLPFSSAGPQSSPQQDEDAKERLCEPDCAQQAMQVGCCAQTNRGGTTASSRANRTQKGNFTMPITPRKPTPFRLVREVFPTRRGRMDSKSSPAVEEHGGEDGIRTRDRAINPMAV